MFYFRRSVPVKFCNISLKSKFSFSQVQTCQILANFTKIKIFHFHMYRRFAPFARLRKSPTISKNSFPALRNQSPCLLTCQMVANQASIHERFELVVSIFCRKLTPYTLPLRRNRPITKTSCSFTPSPQRSIACSASQNRSVHLLQVLSKL